MDTFATKSNVSRALARAYETRDELSGLGMTIAARDPLGVALDFARASNDACISALEKLQDLLPEERAA